MENKESLKAGLRSKRRKARKRVDEFLDPLLSPENLTKQTRKAEKKKKASTGPNRDCTWR